MAEIDRLLAKSLEKSAPGKAVILLGARQTGKTSLLKKMYGSGEDTLWLNGDEQDVRSLFENISAARLKALLAGKRRLVIDEAQRIGDIGLKLKLVTDEVPGIALVATGSSSFDLANKVNESLAGRKREYRLFTLSFAEMVERHGLLEEKRLIPHRLVYGSYPEVVANPGQEREILKELSSSFLYKDILMWEQIKKPEMLTKILQALAWQIGSQVSYSEVAQTVGVDVKTVEKYIALLEQCFVIFRLGSFSRNLRNELKFSKKIYFYDTGLRNAVIADFSLPEMRRDIGALWENYLVSERMKFLSYNKLWKNTWFWRTTSQKEIDYLEEGDGKLCAYEFKWNPAAKIKQNRQFLEAYPGTQIEGISPENVEEFLLV